MAAQAPSVKRPSPGENSKGIGTPSGGGGGITTSPGTEDSLSGIAG